MQKEAIDYRQTGLMSKAFASVKRIDLILDNLAAGQWPRVAAPASCDPLRATGCHRRVECDCRGIIVVVAIVVAAAGLSTGTPVSQKQILSLLCLPFHHAAHARAF